MQLRFFKIISVLLLLTMASNNSFARNNTSNIKYIVGVVPPEFLEKEEFCKIFNLNQSSQDTDTIYNNYLHYRKRVFLNEDNLIRTLLANNEKYRNLRKNLIPFNFKWEINGQSYTLTWAEKNKDAVNDFYSQWKGDMSFFLPEFVKYNNRIINEALNFPCKVRFVVFNLFDPQTKSFSFLLFLYDAEEKTKESQQIDTIKIENLNNEAPDYSTVEQQIRQAIKKTIDKMNKQSLL